ncbi:plasmid replication protein, CyRepA1 family [uncultured Nostoc sp.]|uniref:plasmid replication protein, CyRepA1 family n=1 Tax=uncultured Nostoc sp. TaxID=340711 RepID=UPI002607DF90|nr:plasmid replication protein, CyRepA1 family [uncultured Nostoc sp.]
MRGFCKLPSVDSSLLSTRQELRKVFRRFNKRGNLRRNLPAIKQAAKIEPWEPLPEAMPEAMQLELERSAIDPEIAELNFKSLSGNGGFEYLLYSNRISRRNDGRLRDGDMRRYAHLSNGGWWCDGINVITWLDSLWGCLKPNTPRIDENGKLIKYEHPLKVDTEIFALRVPARIWELISRRYDVALPENYQSLPYSDFWRWVIKNTQIPIILCEGCKKAAAILSCGYVAIGLPGVWGGCRRLKDEYGENSGAPYLIPQLTVFAQPGRRIYFCFDADTKRTAIRTVNCAIAKTAKLLSLRGCEVRVMGWHPALGKGIDDLIVACGREQFDIVYCNVQKLDEWNTRQLRRLTYTPDLSLNQRYLGEISIPSGKQLIGFVSPKNTGKTHLLQWLTDPIIRAGERKVLVITHRVQLATQLVKKLGLPFIDELKETEEGSHFGMGLVIDSLHPKSKAKFNPDEWKGCWLILDEIMQLIWHLLNSTTCQSDRVAIIKNFKRLLLNVVNYGGKIFIADADLNDIGIDFIKGIIGQEIDTFLVENTFKFVEPWQISLVRGNNPAQLIKVLTQKLENGKKCFVALSGQRASSKWGSRNLEAYYRKLLPQLRILRIDSKTTITPAHPAFGCTDNLNEVVKDYDLILTTSTIETGVSIEEKHFDYVFGIFQGVQTTDGVRQHLSRYRPPVPRYIWLAPVGINRVGNGSNSVKALLAGEYKKNRANIKKLVDLGFEESIEGNFESICINTWAKLGAIINDGMNSYDKQIISDLKDEGHIICELSENESPETAEVEATKQAIYENCKEEYTGHCESVAVSESLTDEQFLKLDKQNCKTEEQQLQHRKGEIERRYNILATSDLVEKDDKNWYSLIRLHYYLGTGREFLPDREINVMSTALKNGDGDYFIPDTNKSLIGKKIDALYWLQFNELMQVDEISNNHQLAIELLEKGKKNSYDLKLVLNVDFAKIKTPMEACRRLSALIGHKLPLLRKEGNRNQQIRIYGTPAPDFQRDDEANLVLVDGRAVPVSDRREEVFTAWVERDILAREKAAKAKLEALALTTIPNCQLSAVTEPEINSLPTLEEQYTKPETQTLADVQELSVVSHQSLSDITATKLREVRYWGELNLTQSEVDEAWLLLTQDEQSRLWQLHQEYQQAIATAKTPTVILGETRCRVWHYSQWLEATISYWEDRPHEKFFKAIVNFIDGRDRIVWQRESIQLA